MEKCEAVDMIVKGKKKRAVAVKGRLKVSEERKIIDLEEKSGE